jgi:hypothetical protein
MPVQGEGRRNPPAPLLEAPAGPCSPPPYIIRLSCAIVASRTWRFIVILSDN